MDKQAVFERVAKHLLTQNAPSVTADGSVGPRCLYRAPDGRKCAIGALIADEHYRREFEGMPVDCESILAALKASGVPTPAEGDVDFLQALQQVHDDFDPPDWPRYLRDVAQEYGLCDDFLTAGAP